ncbi:MAG: alpha-L-fucosidase [Planctomycetes bacterium]|nr:alpha-L-fucosidase [Planctomycetota bacterium]
MRYQQLTGVLALLASTGSAPAEEQQSYDPGQAPQEAREWFRDAKFGLFIHWGVYSLLGQGEWVMNNNKIPIAEYEKLPPRFNPTEFDAAEWVSIARRAGQKYITITSKHHDGFCMWGTKQTSYNILDGTPYRKDVLKLLSEECRKQGIKLFFYHSHLDWHHPDYFPRGGTGKHAGRPESGSWARYMDTLNAQIAELCSPPYEAAGIWFDGWWDRPDADWQLSKTYHIIHSLQPSALIGNNHHVKPFPGEDFQMFEQDLPGKNTAGFNQAEVFPMPLETCRTINNSWGYNQGDRGFRPLSQQIRYLVEAVGLGANLLLNVGPMPNGKIQPEAVELLLGMGQWLEKNGGSIYGTRPGPWGPNRWGHAVHKGRRVYFHVLEWPAGGRLVLPRLEGAAGAALLHGPALSVKIEGQSLAIQLPEEARNPIDTIVAIDAPRDLKGLFLPVPPPRTEISGENIRLDAKEAEATGKIRYEGEPKNALGFWTDPKDAIAWRVAARQAGSYEVVLTYACAAGSGGSEIEVACGPSRASGKVFETGDWARFISVPLGAVSIPAGPSEITVRAAAKPSRAQGVMNLRGLELESGFEPLFNGADDSGWRYGEENGRKVGRGYVVENGMLVCPVDGGGNFYTVKEYGDFTFRFEFRLYEGSNNGLGIRAPLAGDAAYTGMEIQILDDEWYKKNYKGLQPWQAHGSIYNVVPAEPGHLRPAGEWNVEEVTCRGRQVTVKLNGAAIVDADLDEARARLDPATRDRHPGLQRDSGHIGFLGHGSRVDFRNIRLKN